MSAPSEPGPGPGSGPDEAAAAAALKAAHKLLKDPDVEKRWLTLSDEELVQEVHSYRAYIRSIGAQLEAYGGDAAMPDVEDPGAASDGSRQSGGESSRGGASGSAPAFTAGNIEDLDPSEWQVGALFTCQRGADV